LAIAGALAIVAIRRKEPEDGNGRKPAPPPGNGPPGDPLAFEPVLLGEATVQVNPF